MNRHPLIMLYRHWRSTHRVSGLTVLAAVNLALGVLVLIAQIVIFVMR